MKKVALVTGGTGGLGTAICKALNKDGFRVIAVAYPGDPSTSDWRDANPYIEVLECDVSDYESCAKLVKYLTYTLGLSIDVLVNNAGITRDTPLKKMTAQQWTDVINTNLNSMFNLTSHVVESMTTKGWGRIINMSSVNGVKGQFGQTNYSAAKAGVLGFTKALAQEVAKKGVTVNAIAPGYIATPMVKAIKPEVLEQLVATVPVGRLGEPEEIGHLVSYLCSDLAGFMTGATLNINGGLHFQ